MIAIKARFDGEKIILPEEARGAPPGDVILVFASDPAQARERLAWTRAEDLAFAKAWDNDEDAIYDSL